MDLRTCQSRVLAGEGKLRYQIRLYREFYNTDFCSIEADARLYGTSYGALGREDLLKSFSISQLSMCRDDENILRQTLEGLGVERIHN